jgi:hypothetical protein
MSAYRRRRSRLWFWLLVFLALPLGYVLSIGPVVYFQGKGWLPTPYPPPLARFYEPVEWLYDNTSMKGPLDFYLHWWSELDDTAFTTKEAPNSEEDPKPKISP